MARFTRDSQHTQHGGEERDLNCHGSSCGNLSYKLQWGKVAKA